MIFIGKLKLFNPELFKLGSELGCLAAALGMNKSVLIDLIRFIEEIPNDDIALKSSLIFVKKLELKGLIKSKWFMRFSTIVKDLSHRKRARTKLISILRIAIQIHEVLSKGISINKCKDIDKILSLLK